MQSCLICSCTLHAAESALFPLEQTDFSPACKQVKQMRCPAAAQGPRANDILACAPTSRGVAVLREGPRCGIELYDMHADEAVSQAQLGGLDPGTGLKKAISAVALRLGNSCLLGLNAAPLDNEKWSNLVVCCQQPAGDWHHESLSSSCCPALSPDGRWLAFVSRQGLAQACSVATGRVHWQHQLRPVPAEVAAGQDQSWNQWRHAVGWTPALALLVTSFDEADSCSAKDQLLVVQF